MPKLYSYVVEHDHGFAPNPCDGLCSLAKCKYGANGWKNIVELAEKYDWIVGTGGANLQKSAGHGKIVYAMRVDEKVSLADYCRRYIGDRIDAEDDIGKRGRSALISRHFFYFGRNAIAIPKRLQGIEQPGIGYRSKFTDEFVKKFITWLESNQEGGVYGAPCQPDPRIRIMLRCGTSKLKQKDCT